MVKVPLLILRGTFNTGRTFPFMVYHMLYTIKMRTKIQVDAFIFLLLCFPLVFTLWFLFTWSLRSKFYLPPYFMPQLYTTRMNVIFLIFSRLESWCDLGRGILTLFQVLGLIVMHVLRVWGISYILLFFTSICKLSLWRELKQKRICYSACMS